LNIKDNGNLILQIADINLSSTETTMDRYVNKPQVRKEVDTKQKIDNKPPPGATVFEFDPNKENFLVIGGVRVTFVEITSYSIQIKERISKIAYEQGR